MRAAGEVQNPPEPGAAGGVVDGGVAAGGVVDGGVADGAPAGSGVSTGVFADVGEAGAVSERSFFISSAGIDIGLLGSVGGTTVPGTSVVVVAAGAPTTTCALVPPKPNELTQARLAFGCHSVGAFGMKNGEPASGKSSLGDSKFAIGGS